MKDHETQVVINLLSEIIFDLFGTIGQQAEYIEKLEAENERLKRPRPADTYRDMLVNYRPDDLDN